MTKKSKIVKIEKGNKTEFVRIGNIMEARGIAKGVSQKDLRDETERFE